MRLALLLILISYLVPSTALAAPTVTSVGEFIDGQSVVISGNSFGSNSSSPEFTKDNIEAGTPGNDFSMTNWGIVSVGGATNPKYSSSMSHSGDNSIVLAWPAGWTSELYYDPGTYQGVMYITYWIYFDHPTETATDIMQFKHFRWRSDTAVGDLAPEWMASTWFNADASILQSYVCDFDAQAESCFASDGAYTNGWPVDRWVRHEFYWVYGATDGILSWQIYENPGVSTPDTEFYSAAFDNGTATSYRYFVFEGYCGNDPANDCENAAAYLDDIYVQFGTQARIEVCGESTWSARTHCEVQQFSSWSASSATITANRGSFQNDSQVYIYVIDDAGDASNGYGPITVGASTPTFEGTQFNGVSVE